MDSGTTKKALAGLVAAVVALWAGLGIWWVARDDTSDDRAVPETTVTPQVETTQPIVNIEGATTDAGDVAAPLAITLGEGGPATEVDEPEVVVVSGEPISPDEAAAMFDTLPPLAPPEPDDDGFNRPAETLPPPIVGETIDAPFPPPGDGDGGPTDPDAGPLEVVRFQPEGEVALAPFLSVTFNRPMVPLATLEQLDLADVPVEITPSVEGRWRWIGTRTLRFEVVPGETDRLPAATEYRVVVPAGTESADGGSLADEFGWTFSTPAPTVANFAGVADTTPLEPVFVAEFDQLVDVDAVLATTTLTVDGEAVELRAATPDEIEEDRVARSAWAGVLDGRGVAFRPTEPLPPDSPFTVTIGPGTPSAEGPLTSASAATYDGRTFGSLEITRSQCNYGSPCEPGAPFTIEFSNALDPAEFSADQITIEPAIAGLQVNVYGSTIDLFGATEGRTTYAVTFDGSLQDVFGQTLGDSETVEFDVGSAPPALQGLPRDWITLDPGADVPQVSVTTVNHDSVRARAWAVSPTDIQAFRQYQEAQWSDADAGEPEWQLVLDETIDIDAERDRFIETAIDLSSAFEQAGSQIVVRIDPTREFSQNDDDYWRNRPTIAWVQSTTLAIDAFFDCDTLVIWTTDLATGEPQSGIPVELIGDGRVATTDSEGLAELELGQDQVLGLYANAGDRTALLPASWFEGWSAQTDSDETRWYIFDDRGIYRPGETARLTGWVREYTRSEDGRLALYDDVTVRYNAWDAQGNEIAVGTTELNPLGGFNLAIEVPEGANLGQAWVEFQLDGEPNAYGNHSFSVQEFRRPEFEVTATNESPGPFYASESATVRVDAEYFSGGPLPNADVNWLVGTQDSTYSPPDWDEFTFGIWTPWWSFGRGDEFFGADIAFDECFDCGPGFSTEYEEFAGVTDAGGSHFLQVGFDGDDVDLPKTVTAEATVFDVNRQAWAARTDLLVHAAEYYVGLRTDRAFVRQGTPFQVDVVVTDVDGTAIPGRDAIVTAGRVEWVLVDGAWEEQLADEQTCEITSTGDATDGSMRCEFGTEVGGQYRITAIVTDDAGRNNRTELTQWVSGGEGRPTRNVERGTVTVVPDAESYRDGDTAELLVQAPFSPAHGTVTVLRNGIVSTDGFEAEDGSAVIEIPIDDSMVPSITVQVDMVGSAIRYDDDGNVVEDAPGQPAYATGQITLPVPPISRALDVSAVPAAASVEPGTDTSVTVSVTDVDGEPVVGADVAIVVVDEAVLSLTGYSLADPLDVFYRDVWANLTSEYTRSSVLLTRSDLLDGDNAARANATTDTAEGEFAADEMSEEAADDGGADAPAAAEGGGSAVTVRTNFDALAVYAPSESTDDLGQVTVDVPLPDSLTRYRVMAVAIDGAEHFGKGESTITARLPLQVRPSAPRFLNFGDRFELPVVLQNQTDEPMEVDVAVETANLELTGAVGKTVTVPPNDRVEVRFPATTVDVGTARYRVVATNGVDTDAAQGELPVYTPATAEAFATYGVLDEGAVAQPTVAPTDVFEQFGGLEINTSSTALQALTDAVLYLADYRYESADSLASRIMAIATLRDVLEAFAADGLPSPAELNGAVNRDLAKLEALQNDDGGYPYWQRGRSSIPYVSIQTTHALVIADQAGYDVPAGTLSRALDHLASIEEFYPSQYSESVRNSLSAYALSVRQQAGQGDTAKATALFERVGDELEPDAVAWLWPSITDAELRDRIERRLLNAAVDTAGAVTFATSYGEDAYVIAHSDRRTDGIVLDALISEAPDSELIPKAVTGLLAGQTKGRWNNAQENAFILIAMNRYFGTFEDVTPDFVARAWLGDLYAAEATFEGRSTDRVSTLVPMDELITAGDSSVVIEKDGEGRLYYRLGLRYAPADLQLDARDEGFVVDRIYEGVDDPADVTRNDDGTWTIKAGATVRITLTMVADARRTHVALIDPLPAGLEPVNPALAVSTTTPPPEGDDGDIAAPGRSWWWGWNWFEHQNLRDDRAEAFASLLPGGTYEYTYIARATTPGEFVVPPARAEEIYAPETFGRSASATVIIE